MRVQSSVYNSDKALFFGLSGTYRLQLWSRGRRRRRYAYQKFWCPFVNLHVARSRINRNLHMNCHKNIDSIYVIVYSLCNSSFFASTVIVVVIPRSNLNRVTGYPNSNWWCILSEFHMNAVIITSHISRPSLHIYQHIGRSRSSFHRIRRCLAFAAETLSSNSLKFWHESELQKRLIDLCT